MLAYRPRYLVLAAGIVLLLLGRAVSSAAPQQPAQQDANRPDRAEAYYHYTLAHLYQQLAQEHMRREYLNQAAEEFEAAIKADPESIHIRLKLIELYARFDRLDDAVSEAQKVLAQNPDNLAVRRLLGESYASYAFDRRGSINQSQLDKAIEQFEQILKIDPKDREALLQISRLYRAAQDSEKAEAALRRLLEIEPDSAEALTNLAFLYLDTGDALRAVEYLERVREAGRSDQVALGALAKAYEQTGDSAKASQIYEELLADGGGNTVPVRRELAKNLMMANKLGEALDQYKFLIEAEPQNHENHLRVSQIYREQRRFDEAQESLKKAAELAPDSLEVKYNAVLLLESQGKGDQAVAAMEQLLKDTEKSNYSPPDKRARVMFLEQLGVLQRTLDNIEGAVKTFRSIGDLDPEARPRSLVHVVDTYRYARKFDRALETSKSAASEFPKNRPIVTMRATVLAETGSTEAGAKLLKGLLNSGDEDLDRETYLSLAQVYEKGRMYDQAVAAAEEASKLVNTEGDQLRVLFVYGSVLEQAKRYDAAEEKFNQLLKIDPDNAAALNYLGFMLADLDKRLDDAHDMIQKALDIDPNNGAYLDSLGWVYYRQQRFELAERFLSRSLEQFERDPVVHSHLGDVYRELGKDQQAKEHWERSLVEWKNSPKADQDPVEIDKVRRKLAQLEAQLSSASGSKKSSDK